MSMAVKKPCLEPLEPAPVIRFQAMFPSTVDHFINIQPSVYIHNQSLNSIKKSSSVFLLSVLQNKSLEFHNSGHPISKKISAKS